MDSISVITILLSIVGVVGVTELAMWLFVVIRRPDHFRFDFEPRTTSVDPRPDQVLRAHEHPRQHFTRR
jgi:hypothetical protein